MPFVKFRKLSGSKEYAVDSLVVLRSMESRAEEIAKEILREASAGLTSSTTETVTVTGTGEQETQQETRQQGATSNTGESQGKTNDHASSQQQGNTTSGSTGGGVTVVDDSSPHVTVFPNMLECSNSHCIAFIHGALRDTLVVLRKDGDSFTTTGSYVIFIDRSAVSGKPRITLDVRGVYKIVKVEPGPEVWPRTYWYRVYYRDRGAKRIVIGRPRNLVDALVSCLRSSSDVENCIASMLKLNVFFAELYKVSRDYYGRELCNHSKADIENEARAIAGGLDTPALRKILEVSNWIPDCDNPSVYKYPFIPSLYIPVARVTPDDAVNLMLGGPGTSVKPKYVLVARKCETKLSEYIENPAYIDSVEVMATRKLDKSTFRSLFTSEFSGILGSSLASRLSDIIYDVLVGTKVDVDKLASELKKYDKVAEHLRGVADGIESSCRILGASSPYNEAWYRLHKKLLSFLQEGSTVHVKLRNGCVARLDERYSVYQLDGCTFYVVDAAVVPAATAGSCGGTEYTINGRCIRFAMSFNYDFAGFDVICPTSLAGSNPRDENARITCASQFGRVATVLREIASKIESEAEEDTAGQQKQGNDKQGGDTSGSGSTTTSGSGQGGSQQAQQQYCSESCRQISMKTYPDPSNRWQYCVTITYECTRRDCTKYTKTDTKCSRCTVVTNTFTIAVYNAPNGTLSKCTAYTCRETGHRIKVECEPVSQQSTSSAGPKESQSQVELPGEKTGTSGSSSSSTTVVLPPIGSSSTQGGSTGAASGNTNIGQARTGTVVVSGGATGAATGSQWQPETYTSGSRLTIQ